MAKIAQPSGMSSSPMPALIQDADAGGGEAMLFAALFGAVVPETSQSAELADGTVEAIDGELMNSEGGDEEAAAGLLAAAIGPVSSGLDGAGEADIPDQHLPAAAQAKQLAQAHLEGKSRTAATTTGKTGLTQGVTQERQLTDANPAEAAEEALVETQKPKIALSKENSGNAKLSHEHLAQLNTGHQKTRKSGEIAIQKQTYKPVAKHTALPSEKMDFQDADGQSEKLKAANLDGAELKLRKTVETETLQKMAEKQLSLKPSEVTTRPFSSEHSDSQSSQASQIVAATGQQNSQFQQQGGQSQTSALPQSSSLSENMAEMLDMMEDNWSEMLVKRIERALGRNAEGIDFELNPRNLGKLRVNLNVVNDQTQVHMKTETQMAAQMIGDAEGRLAQMLEQAGMKLGQFSAQSGYAEQHSQDNAEQQGKQNGEQTAQADEQLEENISEEQNTSSEHVVNLQA